MAEPSEADLRTAELMKLFLEVAGDDREVDWMELKQLLDYSMRDGRFLKFLKYIFCLGMHLLAKV